MTVVAPKPDDAEPSPRGRLWEVAWVFLRLGITAFGGPAAHVALMEREVVRRRRWIQAEKFLDLFGVANLLPGPSSSELAVFIGFERAGWLGLVVAGTCFILPASLLTGSIAWFYVRFGAVPNLGSALVGIKPVVLAIIVQSIWALAPKVLKRPALGALGALSVAASAFGVNPLLVLAGAGALSSVRHRIGNRAEGGDPPAAMLAPVAAAMASAPLTLVGVFLFFLKMGAVVFGGGYVLVAFLRADLVDRLHWLTESQLLDAVAVGQVTPGPVFTTATFIGYLLAGREGAVVATIAIFLPGFVLVAASRPLVARLRGSPTAGAFLDGVNVGSLACMAVVTAQLGRAALVDLPTVLIALLSAALLLVWKLNSAWFVLAGAGLGILLRLQ